MIRTTIIPAAITLILASMLTGCAGELHAERVEGSTQIRLKWQSANADNYPDATPAPLSLGEPSTTGKG